VNDSLGVSVMILLGLIPLHQGTEGLFSLYHHFNFLFISGGYLMSGPTASVLRYEADNLNDQPIKTALLHARHYQACTVFKSPLHSARPVAIVAGGWISKTAEIWDFTQEGASWEQSKFIFV